MRFILLDPSQIFLGISVKCAIFVRFKPNLNMWANISKISRYGI